MRGLFLYLSVPMPNIRPIPITIVIILLPFLSISQDFGSRFEDLWKENDTAGISKLLYEWEKQKPNEAELFIAYYNFYVKRSAEEIVSLEANPHNPQYQLKDSTGKVAGYINSGIAYNKEALERGFSYIDKGTALYPDRLDMRFGKIYMLGEIKDYQEFTKEIIEAIDYSVKIRNAWRWKKNEALKDPENYFLGSLQDYINTLYNSGDEQLPYMRRISEEVLKYYPDHVQSLSNIALTYMINGDNDKGLEYLLRAEKLSPSDIVVINNIAEVYYRKKDNLKSKSYYEKMIKLGNAEEVEYAKEQMKKLK